MSSLKEIKVEVAFLVIGLIFGLIFVFITPPFQAPDEYNHFHRSFDLSQGNVMPSKQGERIGSFIPKEVLETTSTISKKIPFHPENKQKIEEIWNALNIPADRGDKIFVGYTPGPQPLIFPMFFLPQAMGIELGKILMLPSVLLVYLGRISNLIIWAILVFLAIKITPVFKEVFFLLALTPMSLFQAASLSYDCSLNASSFLLVALFLKYSLDDRITIGLKNTIFMTLLSALVALGKIAYAPILLLFFLIPIKKLGRKKYFTYFACLSLSSMAAILIWSSFAKQFLSSSLHPGTTLADLNEKKLFIFNDPIGYGFMVLKTLYRYGPGRIKEFIGVLGWLDAPLPNWLVGSYLAVLIFVSLTDKEQEVRLRITQKMTLAFVFTLSLILILTALWLTWTPPGRALIEGVQGRHFIPISVPLLLLFYNRKINLNINRFSQLIICFSTVTLITTLMVLLNRYWLG